MLCMAHITLSVPDEIYQEMKKHPEIKWSAAARKGIFQQLFYLQGVQDGKEWLRSLPATTQKVIEQLEKLPLESWKSWQKKMREKEWKRSKSWTPTS